MGRKDERYVVLVPVTTYSPQFELLRLVAGIVFTLAGLCLMLCLPFGIYYGVGHSLGLLEFPYGVEQIIISGKPMKSLEFAITYIFFMIAFSLLGLAFWWCGVRALGIHDHYLYEEFTERLSEIFFIAQIKAFFRYLIGIVFIGIGVFNFFTLFNGLDIFDKLTTLFINLTIAYLCLKPLILKFKSHRKKV